jgi:hypothetical protein
MVLHAGLTGADLHEPKGINTAPAGTVYVAIGSATGQWMYLGAGQVDQSSIKNINKFRYTTVLDDLSTASTSFVRFPDNCTVNRIDLVIDKPIQTNPVEFTFTNNSASSLGTLTLPATGSFEGYAAVLLPVANNVFISGGYLKSAVTIPCSNPVKAFITISVVLT